MNVYRTTVENADQSSSQIRHIIAPTPVRAAAKAVSLFARRFSYRVPAKVEVVLLGDAFLAGGKVAV